MLSRDDFERVVKGVPSHGTERHAQVMYGIIRWLQPYSVVEVGSCHGYTSCWLARAVQDNNVLLGGDAKLTVIDNYSLYPQSYIAFWHNVGMCQVGNIVQVSNADSKVAEWPERVDFAYVDADHSFEGCKFDVEKAIALGAQCICIHDTTNWWGPRQYMEEAFPDGWTEVSVGFDEGFTVMMKRPEKGPVGFTQERYPEGHI